MGADHDHGHGHAHDRRVLWIVLALNFSVFWLEIWQGTRADSTALLADAMDFLSDSFSYLITLYVLAKPLRVRATAALVKGVLMLLLALFTILQGAHHVVSGSVPEAFTMGWVAGIALAVNTVSAALLFGARGQDSNRNSIWLCSRNDMLANLLILAAAWVVHLTGTLWPDVIVAVLITWLGGSAALRIIRQARGELRVR